jgi:hypothetical protein
VDASAGTSCTDVPSATTFNHETVANGDLWECMISLQLESMLQRHMVHDDNVREQFWLRHIICFTAT